MEHIIERKPLISEEWSGRYEIFCFDLKRWLKFNDDALEGLSFLKRERRKNLDLESNSWNLFFKRLKKMD